MGASKRQPRVLFFGTYESTFPRSKTLAAALTEEGIEVLTCHEPLFELVRDKTKTFKGPRLLWLVLKLVGAYLKLLARYVVLPDYDVMLIGYMGYLDVFLGRLLAGRRRLALSPVVSLYETMVGDRQMVSHKSLKAGILKGIDRWGCLLADVILLETNQYIDYYSKTFRVPREKFHRIFLGADEANFVPIPGADDRKDGSFLVFFYGKFTPLQGIPYILKAAARVDGGAKTRAAAKIEDQQEIRFEIVGSGQLSEEMAGLASELSLEQVDFIDWVPYEELPMHIARADVCLGIFGDTEKAQRGVPVKAFDALAMGRPLIHGDTEAAREVLDHGESALLVPMANEEALAQAILELKEDESLRRKLAAGARNAFLERFSRKRLGAAVREALGLPEPSTD